MAESTRPDAPLERNLLEQLAKMEAQGGMLTVFEKCALSCIREQQAALEVLLDEDKFSTVNYPARKEARATLAKWRIE